MLIGIDASRANRNRKTGTEWYSYYLIRELARLDENNQYILYTDKPLTGGLADLSLLTPETTAPIEFDGDYQIIKSPYNNFKAKVLSWPLRVFWTLGRLSLEMLQHAPDCLFVPAHTLPLIRPHKSIVTIHDIGFKRETDLYGSGRVAGVGGIINALALLITGGRYGAGQVDYLDWSTAFALKKAKKIITISEFSKQEIKEVYKTPDKKLEVIYNGYDDNLYYPRQNNAITKDVLNKYGITQPFIFGVGRLEKKKNTVRLIEAFALLKTEHSSLPHQLVLIGSANYGFREVRQIISEYELSNEVILPGWVDEADMPIIYSAAEMFVFPSNYEGFGIPLLEAMACNTPIAASKTASLPEIACEAAVYFDPKNTREIAEKIADVLLSAKLREKLVEAGAKRVKNFSWEKSAKATLKIIENL
ncbi:hypothetical protein COT94_01315 [Candidatus Falkowbacteria bacterium CG10_big_fil_rev_8_21_14_0_10_37_14]|uniref:Glycosyltransferase family 1 protein n=1 Tax=Candidatus Falkowbacteria bacterium CG10_big_fil_rev_8_21_14_0_10_37_14 TaxID=1974561 RepID=A0A2M6WU52_9BACT|nr:glycosyltransferase family 4 protein [Candidatus Falkowbacteria bacterium]PIT96314.1 MAG: hypothetical protein COT94_01315 [Candidatus Falkowbacteria bacterium CG10_big_fil_rev_8_21_14_0_10_37_14]